MGVQLIENRSEIGAGTRGASMGVEALKVASHNKGSKYFGNHDAIAISDSNYLLNEDVNSPNAKRINGIVEVYKKVSSAVETTLAKGDFPLVLAADHASAGGTIAGIKKHYPQKKLGVIWVDAHADLHSPFTSPSGNVHGMPLATALGEDNIAFQINDVDENTLEHWESLKECGGLFPKIEYDNLVFFGVRDTERPEDELIEKNNIKNFTVEECRELGHDKAANQALEKLDSCDIIYISFDVDSMDCDKVSYGTGTPVPNGFLPQEVSSILKTLIKSEKVCCFEIVEINPTLDTVNKMAETAFSILEEITGVIQNRI